MLEGAAQQPRALAKISRAEANDNRKWNMSEPQQVTNGKLSLPPTSSPLTADTERELSSKAPCECDFPVPLCDALPPHAAVVHMKPALSNRLPPSCSTLILHHSPRAPLAALYRHDYLYLNAFSTRTVQPSPVRQASPYAFRSPPNGTTCMSTATMASNANTSSSATRRPQARGLAAIYGSDYRYIAAISRPTSSIVLQSPANGAATDGVNEGVPSSYSPNTIASFMTVTNPTPRERLRRQRKPHPPQKRFYVAFDRRKEDPKGGHSTPGSEITNPKHRASKSAFYFEAGYALFAKRASKPFPPPFLSVPSSSFSDPLSTHNRSRDRRKGETYGGEVIRGITNGDDAVLVSENLIAANDGVGAWAQKERGHAALWSRLICHFWALEAEKDGYGAEGSDGPDMTAYLAKAFESTKDATSEPNEWFGTTTASGALMGQSKDGTEPLLHVTQLGDSQIIVIRPDPMEDGQVEDPGEIQEYVDEWGDIKTRKVYKEPKKADKDKEEGPGGQVIYKTKEQWHWFDCPRQLGTNSPDTPSDNAVTDHVPLQINDIILAMSDGVADNLWEHEIVTTVTQSLKKLRLKEGATKQRFADGMQVIAKDLVKAAMAIATDQFAESPFMERAIEEGLSIEGGKLDDISVVCAICRSRKSEVHR